MTNGGIALCGAHRTGKSTLARRFAEKHDVSFVPSIAGEVLKHHHFDYNAPHTLDEILTVQEYVLHAHVAQIVQVSGPFISDRSTLDMAAYVMIKVPFSPIPGSIGARAMCYVNECLLLADQLYDRVVQVHPGIDYVSEPGKPVYDLREIEHFDGILTYLRNDGRMSIPSHAIPRRMLDLEMRVAQVGKMAGNVAVAA